MPPRSPNAGRRTQGSRSAGKPRPTPVLLALQQHEYLSEQSHHELGAHILQSLMEMQPNCPPNFELDFRRLVPLGPEGDITQAWLNDTLLSVGVKLLVVEKDERILQVFSHSWDTAKRWNRLADRLEALEH